MLDLDVYLFYCIDFQNFHYANIFKFKVYKYVCSSKCDPSKRIFLAQQKKYGFFSNLEILTSN